MNTILLNWIVPHVLFALVVVFPRAQLVRVRERFIEVETFNPWRWLLLQNARQLWVVQRLSTGYPMCLDAANTKTNKTVGIYEWRGVRRAVMSIREVRHIWEEAAK